MSLLQMCGWKRSFALILDGELREENAIHVVTKDDLLTMAFTDHIEVAKALVRQNIVSRGAQRGMQHRKKSMMHAIFTMKHQY